MLTMASFVIIVERKVYQIVSTLLSGRYRRMSKYGPRRDGADIRGGRPMQPIQHGRQHADHPVSRRVKRVDARPGHVQDVVRAHK